MLVEGPQTLNRPLGEPGVSTRRVSLPSSSEETRNGPLRRASPEEEGIPPLAEGVEDLLSLSVTADSQTFAFREQNRPENPSVGEGAPRIPEGQAEIRVEKEVAGDGPGVLIQENLDAARTREAERQTQIQESLQGELNANLSLRFYQDEDTGQDFFQLIEPESGEVVRQFPPEAVLEFVKRFQSVTGMLFSEQA